MSKNPIDEVGLNLLDESVQLGVKSELNTFRMFYQQFYPSVHAYMPKHSGILHFAWADGYSVFTLWTTQDLTSASVLPCGF